MAMSKHRRSLPIISLCLYELLIVESISENRSMLACEQANSMCFVLNKHSHFRWLFLCLLSNMQRLITCVWRMYCRRNETFPLCLLKWTFAASLLHEKYTKQIFNSIRLSWYRDKACGCALKCHWVCSCNGEWTSKQQNISKRAHLDRYVLQRTRLYKGKHLSQSTSRYFGRMTQSIWERNVCK